MTIDAKLQDLLDDVQYEHLMLHRGAVILQHLDGYLEYAVLESCCVHLGGLIEFLHVTNGDKDVKAGHYVADWDDDKPEYTEDLREAWKRVSQRVVHLSLKRHEERVFWDINALYKALDEHMKVFYCRAIDAGYTLPYPALNQPLLI